MLTLNVVAVDTNVEADRPGIGQNKETLVFKLVSDGELLTEIAREEAGLADKLDDAIRRHGRCGQQAALDWSPGCRA